MIRIGRKTLTVSLDDEDLQTIETLSLMDKRSKSSVVRKALSIYKDTMEVNINENSRREAEDQGTAFPSDR